MSGLASAASVDLAAQSKGKPVPEIHSQSKRKPDSENHSESYEEPVPEIPSESEREPVTEIPSKSERETVPEIPSKSEREPVPEIPSQSEREPVPEIHSTSYEDPVPDIHSEGKRKPDAEIQSESYEEPVPEIHSESEREPVTEIPSKSERETVPGIPSKNKRDPVPEIRSQSEREPVPEIHSTSKRELIAEIPSKCKRVKDLASEIPSTSKRKPKILTESERDSDADSDDGQRRLPDGSAKMDPLAEIPSECKRVKDPASEIPSTSKRKPKILTESERDSDADSDDGQRRLSDVSIFKIPDSLKDRKREAYVPQRILLGPYHHGSREIPAIDHYKERALRKMRTTTNDADFARNAIEAILKKKNEIRNSYEEGINWDGKRLARILCVDGCFILEVLKNLDEGRELNNDPFWESKVSASNALKDILMLENQIPWIVLLELLRLENPEDDDVERTLLKVMVNGTCGLFIISSEDRTALLKLDWLQAPATKVHHLLDFVHKVIVLRPPNQANPRNQGEHRISIQMLADNNEALNHDFESIPTAVQLKNAGIKFRPYNGGIGQINFYWDSSTIYLPLLSITYDTEVLFRNLISFEKYRPSELNYVSSYVNLMADLIDSQNDVAFLRSIGILTHPHVNDKEVADLFNGLFEGVTVGMPDIFAELRKVVNTDYKNRCGNCKNGIRVQLAELWRDHFSSPCKALALAVTSVALCLTIIQTIYTVKK